MSNIYYPNCQAEYNEQFIKNEANNIEALIL